MPQKPNKLRRAVLTILLFVGVIGVGTAVLINTSRQGKGTPAPKSTAASTPPAPATEKPVEPTKPEPSPAPTPAGQAETQPTTTPPSTTPATDQPATAPKYTAKAHPTAEPFAVIGSLEPTDGYEMQVKVSPFGAGIESLSLTNEYTTIYQTAHEQLQSYHVNISAPNTGVAPFAVVGVEVDGVTVPLGAAPEEKTSYWHQTAPGAFEATILDEKSEPVLRVTRKFELEKGSHDLIVRQGVENLRGTPVTIRWFQFGPADLPVGSERLQLDKRRVRFGYLNNPQIDPSRQIVDASRFLIDRPKTLGKAAIDHGTGLHYWPGVPLWPNAEATDKQLSLCWVGLTSRHFCVVLHPLVDPKASNPEKTFRLGASVNSFVLPGYKDDASDAAVAVALESEKIVVPASGRVALDTGIFAGPQSRKFMTEKEEPRASVMNLGRIVVYTLGGPCGFCTFQSLTGVLYWWLTVLHDYIVFDYALGIILLVVCMRTILHPVTRHAQISMQRFSKQMQALAPKQKKIQEKYASDPQKMREEMARLMREEHLSYSSAAKGCITPFLQTPVWIALYAMLFFMYELRHTPAFFGVFQWASQAIAGKKWSFLADLSEADHFISFGHSYDIWGLSMLIGKVDGLNILPLLLGVVFYIQQKYLTPPSTTPLTPEQQQQQKMMKIITVVMFPLFMYSQPAGLTLYFVVNSTLGIIESRYIRRHAEKYDLLAPPKRPTPTGKEPPKKPGLFARLQAMAETKQKEIEKRRKDTGKGRKR